jgi:iron complex outermembrane receptor protein
MKASYGDFTLEGAFSHRKKEVPTASFGTDFNAAESTTDDIGYVDLRYERVFSGARRVDLSLSYNDYYYKGLYPYRGIINYDSAKGRWAGLEGSTIQPLGQHQKVVVGAEFRDNLHQDQRNYDVDTSTIYLDSRESSRNWALFAQDEVRLGDRIILNLGVRHDHYDTFGATTNPRVAVIWRTGEETALKLLLGRAFRAPSDYELFYSSVVQKPNPSARPETIRSAELILESSFAGMRATAALYQNRIQGLLALTEDPSDALLQYRNIDRAQARGLELTLNGAMARRFDGRISYTFQDARDGRTDERLTNSPQHLAKASLAAMIIPDRLTASLEALYTSDTRANDGTAVGASAIFNLGLRYHPWRSRVELGAWVRNLTGARYSNTASEEHVQRLIQQDGRNYRVAASYEF